MSTIFIGKSSFEELWCKHKPTSDMDKRSGYSWIGNHAYEKLTCFNFASFALVSNDSRKSPLPVIKMFKCGSRCFVFFFFFVAVPLASFAFSSYNTAACNKTSKSSSGVHEVLETTFTTSLVFFRNPFFFSLVALVFNRKNCSPGASFTTEMCLASMLHSRIKKSFIFSVTVK